VQDHFIAGGIIMIQITFRNMENSPLVKSAVLSRLQPLLAKFEELKMAKIFVTIEMENSPTQAGPDLFNVKLHIANGRFREITLCKSDSNMYKALAALVDHMLEKLNRSIDRKRVKSRSKSRALVHHSTN
jgi:ribosome-associated translation inhibitor RaiA